MKKSIAIFLFPAIILLFTVPTHGQGIYGGSTAVCIATKDSILIGADSKLLLLDRKGNLNEAGRACKVHRQNNLVYAAVGILFNKFPPFDPIRIISDLPMKDSSLRKKMEAVVTATKDGYKMVLDEAEANSPLYFKDKMLGKTFTTFLFGSFENGKPVIGFLSFKCKKSSNGVTYVKDSIIINYEVPLCLAIGHSRSIDSILVSNPEFVGNGRSVMEGIIELIRYESKRTPLEVNDRINLIGISCNGTKWYQKFQECN